MSIEKFSRVLSVLYDLEDNCSIPFEMLERLEEAEKILLEVMNEGTN